MFKNFISLVVGLVFCFFSFSISSNAFQANPFQINIKNNSSVVLQYYVCNGSEPAQINFGNNIFGTTAGVYYNINQNINAGQTKNINIVNYNPGNTTVKIAPGAQLPTDGVRSICEQNYQYVKSFDIPATTPENETITVEGADDSTLVNGFVNASIPWFTITEYDLRANNNPVFRFYDISVADWTKICINNTPTLISEINTSGFINQQTTITEFNNVSQGCTQSGGVVFTPATNKSYLFKKTYTNGNNPQIVIDREVYLPSQTGIYAFNGVGTVSPQVGPNASTGTPMTKLCINNTVRDEVQVGSHYFLLNTGDNIRPVGSTGNCELDVAPTVVEIPQNKFQRYETGLVFVNDPFTVSMSMGQISVPEYRTVLEFGTDVKLIPGTTSTYGAKVILENDGQGNYSIVGGSGDTSKTNEVEFELVYADQLTAGDTSVVITTTNNKVGLIRGGIGLPRDAEMVSKAYSLSTTGIANPNTPLLFSSIKATWNQSDILKPIGELETRNLTSAYASNSPFAPYPITYNQTTISATVPNGFKQIGLFEDSTNILESGNGTVLIRTGGSD
jgi:hypothetical protein